VNLKQSHSIRDCRVKSLACVSVCVCVCVCVYLYIQYDSNDYKLRCHSLGKRQ
jgi:hypothetical protein